LAFDRTKYPTRKSSEIDDALDGGSNEGPAAVNESKSNCPPSGRGVFELRQLLHNLDPHQQSGVWVYAEMSTDVPLPTGTVVAITEDEGRRTIVLPEHDAIAAGLQPAFRAAWITLRVHSALEAIGLVAKVSGALADAGIACNVIAGARHDHILVPYDLARKAMNVLRDLQCQNELSCPPGNRAR